MRSDKAQSKTTPRQQIIGIVVLLLLVFIGWQVVGMFRGKEKPQTPANNVAASNKNMVADAPTTMPQPPATPKPAAIDTTQMTEREMALLKMQQETQAKYLAALNELQMLKVERDIAETNKAIVTAKFDTVTAQKNILDLLTRTTGTGASQGEVQIPRPQETTQPTQAAQPAPPPAPIFGVNYSVISVTQLRYRWNAVISAQGSLYNVAVGDVLPPDGSTVYSIDKTGVVIDKNGVKKKLSIVSII